MPTGKYWNSGIVDKSLPPAETVATDQPRRRDYEQLQSEAQFFLKLGLGKPAILAAARAARQNRTTIERELLASGLLDAAIYYEMIAAWMKLPFLDRIAPDDVFLTEMIDTQLVSFPRVRISRPARPALLVIAPDLDHARALRDRLQAEPGMRAGLAVATPGAIRSAIWQANRRNRLSLINNRLREAAPSLSAATVLTGWQGYLAGMASVALPLIAVLYPGPALLVLHIALTALYFMATVLRGVALKAGTRAESPPALLSSLDEPDLPVYSVLVAAYREEAMVHQMVAALDRLDWPKSLLDIKIVCEADDHETIAAVRRHVTGPHFEIVEVPPGEPRTKPKALLYALAGARGDYVVIYDAEDRPHPGQLREAHRRFAAGPHDLACLQAPLVISNAAASPIAAVFALEYAGQFRSLLPLLARFGLPMPLGGTSNHFRRSALQASGAWDPFNVTEDADLGIRLSRLGYRCGVLTRPTLEDAPTTWPVWRKQRTRWFKGWLQTMLVHFRSPLRLYRQVGPLGMAGIFLTTGGMLFSALAHPLLFVFILRSLWLFFDDRWLASSLAEQILFGVDVFNVLGSYSLFALLGRKPMSREERRAARGAWPGIPLYWMMLSLSAWCAARELAKRPFFWHKTPHEPTVGRKPGSAGEKARDIGQEKPVQREDDHRAHHAQHHDEPIIREFAHDRTL